MGLRFAFVLICALIVTEPVAHAALIYQGFRFEWQRKIVDFETPHRIGTTASAILPLPTGGSQPPQNQYELDTAWTPGVVEARVHWVDHIQGPSDAPTATHTATVPLSGLMPAGTGPILTGWKIQMGCNNISGSCTEAGLSTGIWPVVFDFGIRSGNTSAANELSVTITRGWTPTHGGGKPLTKSMWYNATFFVQAIPSTRLSRPPVLARATANLHDHHVSPARVCSPRQKRSTVFAVRRFKFQLIETDGMKNLGRYIETMEFYAKPAAASSKRFAVVGSSRHLSPAKDCADVTMRLASPLTVLPAKYETEMELQPLDVDADSVVASSKYINGTICVSGTPPYGFFNCEIHGMKNDCEDRVPFTPGNQRR